MTRPPIEPWWPQESVLEALRPWLRVVARSMLRAEDVRHVEDLAQEGWIAAWRSIPGYNPSGGAFEPWLHSCAKNAMRNVIRDRQALRRDDRQTLLVDDVLAVWDGGEALAGIELAYHHGDIAHALDVLSPQQREYVVLRFWGGLEAAQLNAHFRTLNSGSIWTAARRKLREQLAHLI